MHKVCGTLDHCFITTHSIHKECDILQIYFCVIFHETRCHAQAHVPSGALCPFFGRENTDSWVDFAGHCLLRLLLPRLAAVVPLLLLPQNTLLTLPAFAPDSEAASAIRISLMASSSSFIFFFPAIAQDPQSTALFRLLCMMAKFQKRNTSQI